MEPVLLKKLFQKLWAEKTKNFEIYRKFFIAKLKENKIEIVYIIKPLWGGDNVLKSVLNENCVEKKIITDILESQLLLKCEDLEN